MEQTLLVPKRSIKPYTKDRTKMTITKEALEDYGLRERLRLIANAVTYFTVSHNAVPAFPQNEEIRDSYLTGLFDQVKALEELLNEQD